MCGADSTYAPNGDSRISGVVARSIKHLTPERGEELVGTYLMRRPRADSSINLSSRLSLVSSRFALITHQFITLR